MNFYYMYLMNYILEKERDKFWIHTLSVEDEYEETRRERSTKCKRHLVVSKERSPTSRDGIFAFAKVRIYRDLEYNGWPGWERRAPVAKVANLWAAPRLFRDLRAEEKCIALNKFMARPRLWSTRSSWRAPRRVSPNRNSPLVLQPTSLLSLGRSGAVHFHGEASIAAGYLPNLFSFR